MIRKSVLLAVIALFAAAPATMAAEAHKLDRAHSETTFQVRHLISKVSGNFSDFDAVINLDFEKPEASTVEFKINAASINTNNTKRDDHLRSEDFFFVDKHPQITFKSTSIRSAGTNRFDVTGDFTMRGVTKSLTLPVIYLGSIKDPRGNEKHGFEISTTINRKDYEIVWNSVLDSGGTLLSDEVDVRISLQTSRQK
jgi:polyisoprenoid-binding protein YceI